MILESEEIKRRYEEHYKRLMPCGEPTDYERGLLDGISYCIKVLKFIPEAEQPRQLVFEAFMEEL